MCVPNPYYTQNRQKSQIFKVMVPHFLVELRLSFVPSGKFDVVSVCVCVCVYM
jgi:hypothetical protein